MEEGEMTGAKNWELILAVMYSYCLCDPGQASKINFNS